MPKVSVIIPNYNHARFLKQRIQSILDQTYQDFEIIYLDDASTDNSNEIFSQFIPNPRIRAIHNQINSGSPFKQWNKGIKQALGEYIWIAESDDYADPTFLETLVNILDSRSEVGLAYSQSYQIDSNGACSTTMHWWTDDLSTTRWRGDFVNNGQDECRNYLLIKNTIPNASAVLVRKEIFEKVGYAEESMAFCGDWLTWNKVLFCTDVAFSAKALNYFRKHNTSVTSSTSIGTYLYEKICIFAFINQRFEASKQTKRVREQLIKEWLVSLSGKNNRISPKLSINIYTALKSCTPYLELEVLKIVITFISRKIVSSIRSYPLVSK